MWGGFPSFYCFLLLGPHLLPMEVPRLGVTSDLQLQAYARARAMWDPSRVWDLQRSSRQPRILILLKEAGIEHASSWILGGLMSAEPQWELLAFAGVKKSTAREVGVAFDSVPAFYPPMSNLHVYKPTPVDVLACKPCLKAGAFPVCTPYPCSLESRLIIAYGPVCMGITVASLTQQNGDTNETKFSESYFHIGS